MQNKCEDRSYFNLNHVTPSCPLSLINYLPSSHCGSIPNASADENKSGSQLDTEILKTDIQNPRADDERCAELMRNIQEESGPWSSHRFSAFEWNTDDLVSSGRNLSKIKKKSSNNSITENLEENVTVLTDELVASNLFRLDQCPEMGYYIYTKCVLHKQNLDEIEAIKAYHYIQYLDISDNRLTSLNVLGNLPFLKYLDASHNSLMVILDFKAPFFLTDVDLSYNKFSSIPDLSDFWSIVKLNLAHNMIGSIRGLTGLKYLSSLNLSHNRIKIINNLRNLRIQYLNLQNNYITSSDNHDDSDQFEPLITLTSIRKINVAGNQIKSLKMFECVKNLECLNIANNEINQLFDIYYLRNVKYLSKLDLSGNPVTSSSRYKEVCVTNLQSLVLLDSEKIDYDYWHQQLTNRPIDFAQKAAHERLKLLLLEQFNRPQLRDWMLPFDSYILNIIVLVGVEGSSRARIAKSFSKINKKAAFCISHTTKPKNDTEIEGDFFYFVDKETFENMLRKGDFFLYDENSEYSSGITYDEINKVKNKIIILYTSLVMGLALKTKMLNTKLVLAIPSSANQLKKNLLSLYSLEPINSSTMKIVGSAIFTVERVRNFMANQKKALEKEIKNLLNNIINKVCQNLTEAVNETNDTDFYQLWINAGNQDPNNESTGHMHLLEKERDIKTNNRNSLETDQPTIVTSDSNVFDYNGQQVPSRNPLLLDKSVSFAAHILHYNEIISSLGTLDSLGDSEFIEYNHLNLDEELNILSKDELGNNSEYYLKYNNYLDSIANEPRFKKILESILKQREELLETHWSMPGLFQQLIFTDNETETFQKLNGLVDQIKSSSRLPKKNDILHFTQDEFDIIKEKLDICLRDLNNELSTSDKQAAEILDGIDEEITDSHVCGKTSPEHLHKWFDFK